MENYICLTYARVWWNEVILPFLYCSVINLRQILILIFKFLFSGINQAKGATTEDREKIRRHQQHIKIQPETYTRHQECIWQSEELSQWQIVRCSDTINKIVRVFQFWIDDLSRIVQYIRTGTKGHEHVVFVDNDTGELRRSWSGRR